MNTMGMVAALAAVSSDALHYYEEEGWSIMKTSIEILAAPGCRKCAAAQAELHAVAAAVIGEENLIWREVNVREELDYAVTLGVLTMPAIAVNGELRFSSLPTPAQFRAGLLPLVSP